jgi:uncharacterized membrane protein
LQPELSLASSDGHQFALKLSPISPVPSTAQCKRESAVSKHEIDDNRGARPAHPVPVPAGDEARPTQDFVTTAATIGLIAAGVALFEVALIPGMVIGGAAVLAPKYLPKLHRRLRPLFHSTVRRRIDPVIPLAGRAQVKALLAAPSRLVIKQAIAKTITFRIIVTTLDFTVNYVVLGELAVAAGLSAFALIVGPVFYLVHETAWNYFGASDKRVDLTVLLPLPPDSKMSLSARGGFTISRALAKTITFRTLATAMDFTTNFVGRRRPRNGGGAIGFRLRPRSLCLSRPRDGLGLFWLVRRAHVRSADANKPPTSAWLRVAATQNRMSFTGVSGSWVTCQGTPDRVYQKSFTGRQ